jgi:hypothetical protein
MCRNQLSFMPFVCCRQVHQLLLARLTTNGQTDRRTVFWFCFVKQNKPKNHKKPKNTKKHQKNTTKQTKTIKNKTGRQAGRRADGRTDWYTGSQTDRHGCLFHTLCAARKPTRSSCPGSSSTVSQTDRHGCFFIPGVPPGSPPSPPAPAPAAPSGCSGR